MNERILVPGMRLGKKPADPERNKKALQFDRYIAPLPTAPGFYDASDGVSSWPMYANDSHGDCTCAAAGHMLEVWSKQVTGSPRIVADSDILALYGKVNGGVDQGASEYDVLNTWRADGLAGDTLFAFAAVDPSNHQLVQAACWLFSGLYIGIAMPITAQSQAVWDVVPAAPSQNGPGTWGGHAVSIIGYDAAGLTCVTWGATKQLTWAFWSEYVDECWVCIPQDYDQLAGKALENGFNLDQLKVDLVSIGSID